MAWPASSSSRTTPTSSSTRARKRARAARHTRQSAARISASFRSGRERGDGPRRSAAVSGLTGRAAAPRGTLRLWLLASRPRTLPAAIAPVLVGTSLAATEDQFSVLPFLAALVGSVFIQIGTYVAFGIAVAAGLYLAAVAGWELLVVGAASILAGVLYTGGPRPYGYEGLGELFVFVFFGLVAVAGSYYVQAGELPWEALALGVPVGLLAAAILVVNNIRDVETDRRAGKRTLAVKLGRERARSLFVAMVVVALLAPLVVAAAGGL